MDIEFADRVGKLPEYIFGRLNAAKLSRRRAGEDIIDLGMGNPNDPTPDPIIRKLTEAVQDPRSHRYSVSADGIFNLKREVARFYRREHGVEVDPETEVVCTIGSKEGLSHLALVLVEPGETAIVPTPAFPPHVHSVTLAGGRVVGPRVSGGVGLFEELDELVTRLERKPKFLLLNYPHNPTTLTVEPEFFARAVEFARAHQILIIHDFAYSHITFDGYRAPSFLAAPGAREVGVEFSSMSKSFNMAGWRVGFCVGHPDVVGGLARIKGYYDYGMFMPVQIASIIALRNCMDAVHRQAEVYQGRRDTLCEGLERVGWPVEKPRGTMFVWAPIPEGFRSMGSVDFCFMLLEEADVAVAPGAAFGEGGDGFVRMALVENKQRLRQAVRQIGRVLRARSG
ncbi:MAG: aminotransferase class I/II-fold pyridoxal phosphate-dependent enzyme [Candidatus Brocadiaceae bacterium]|jgi:alanine-synthesizing transaminase